MYYVMFYGGIICAIISVVYAIYVFVKKDVPGCVRDVKHKRNLLFAGIIVAGMIMNICENDVAMRIREAQRACAKSVKMNENANINRLSAGTETGKNEENVDKESGSKTGNEKSGEAESGGETGNETSGEAESGGETGNETSGEAESGGETGNETSGEAKSGGETEEKVLDIVVIATDEEKSNCVTGTCKTFIEENEREEEEGTGTKETEEGKKTEESKENEEEREGKEAKESKEVEESKEGNVEGDEGKSGKQQDSEPRNVSDIGTDNIIWTNEDVELKVELHYTNNLERVSYTIGENEEVVVSDYEEDAFTITVSDTAKDSAGVPISITVVDAKGNRAVYEGNVFVDKTAPVIGDWSYKIKDKNVKLRAGNIYTNEGLCVSVPVSDEGSGIDKGLTGAKFVTGAVDDIDAKEDSMTRNESGEVDGDSSVIDLEIFEGGKGDYYAFIPIKDNAGGLDGCVVFSFKDMAGNVVAKKSSRIIYNIRKPMINLVVQSEYGKWTSKNDKARIDVKAPGCGIKKMAIYVAGEKVKEDKPEDILEELTCTLKLDKSAAKHTGYTVEVRVTDNCGNESRKKKRVFIDKEAPEIKVTGVESDSYNADDVEIKVDVEEVSFPDTVVEYKATRIFHGKTDKVKMDAFMPKDYKDRDILHFSKEGEYEISVTAVDGAGNVGTIGNIHFFIDKTPPEVFVQGVEEGAVKNKDVTLDLICEEDYFETNMVYAKVRRSIDGRVEVEEPQMFEHSARVEKRTRVFSKDGEYEVSLSAKDKAGNETVEKVVHFTVDKTAPKISVTGTKPYGKWDKGVTLNVGVEESFYNKSKVAVNATKTNMDGDKSNVVLPEMSLDNRLSKEVLSFEEEGIYRLSVSVRDGAGNISKKQVDFLIDTTKPIISGIDGHDGKYYKSFCPDNLMDGLFKDLTLNYCELYLNGIEYDGESEITEEGKYVLSAKASDELGHVNEKSASFIVDHTPPEIVFSGAMDGEQVDEPGTVSWQLIDSDDMIEKIIINGKEYDADLQDISYNDYGTYDIQIESIDRAGNKGLARLNFQYIKPMGLFRAKSGGGGGLEENGKVDIVAKPDGVENKASFIGRMSIRRLGVLLSVVIVCMLGVIILTVVKIKKKNNA